MKSNIFIIIVLCFSKTLIAQDSLRVSTVIDSTFKTPQYETVFDDIFLSHQETKGLLKVAAWDLLILNEGDIREYRIEYERKLNSAFSINTTLSARNSTTTSIAVQSRNIINSWGVAFEIEPRWYYLMPKKIANHESANNLSGNYWGLKMGMEVIPTYGADILLRYRKNWATSEILSNVMVQNTEALKSYHLEANYGIQRRLLQNNYVHFAFGLGVAREDAVRIDDAFNEVLSTRSFWRLYLNNHVTFGFAFGRKNRAAKTEVQACDLFRCFEEEDKWLKVNLLGLLKTLDTRNVSGQAAVSYEVWLYKDRHISLNSSVSVTGKYLSRPHEELLSANKTDITSFTFAVGIEPRYYYKLKKEIARGNSARSFSGAYFGFPIAYTAVQNNNPDLSNNFKGLTRGIVWGVQRKLYKNGYADINLGLGSLNSPSLTPTQKGASLTIITKAELGFAF